MEHLKLFENFDSNYLWPEAKFWFHKLEPEELCFLGVYSYMLEMNKKQPLFEVEYDGSKDSEPDEEGEGSLEMIYVFFPTIEAEYWPTLSCDVSFRGGFQKFYPATHNDPAEGGEYGLTSVSIDNIYYLDKDQINEYEFDLMEYKSEFISKKDIINLLEYVSSYFINKDEDVTNSKIPVIPPGLKDKCENLRKEIPNVTKGYGMISRFTGK